VVTESAGIISFVVPAYNEERLIGRTLDAIHATAREIGQHYEVIVADDASTDRTAAIARAHGARVIAVRFRQIARVRNAGARAATGSVLIFVDADTIVTPVTVRRTLDALAGGAAGGGAAIAFDGVLPVWVRVLLPILRAAFRAGGLAAGCYMFCSRRAFDAAGGFDEGLYAAEEIAFSQALKKQGRVVILRDTVTTSGRKLRTHSASEVVRLCGKLMRRGTALVRSREHLSLWYGDRRDDVDPSSFLEETRTRTRP